MSTISKEKMDNLDKKTITSIQAWAVGTSLKTLVDNLHLSWYIKAFYGEGGASFRYKKIQVKVKIIKYVP